jgi:hypothetical protein
MRKVIVTLAPASSAPFVFMCEASAGSSSSRNGTRVSGKGLKSLFPPVVGSHFFGSCPLPVSRTPSPCPVTSSEKKRPRSTAPRPPPSYAWDTVSTSPVAPTPAAGSGRLPPNVPSRRRALGSPQDVGAVPCPGRLAWGNLGRRGRREVSALPRQPARQPSGLPDPARQRKTGPVSHLNRRCGESTACLLPATADEIQPTLRAALGLSSDAGKHEVATARARSLSGFAERLLKSAEAQSSSRIIAPGSPAMQ